MNVEPGSLCGIHLDLKYHMPNKQYLLDWLTRLPGYGIDTILVEYEDKFPFAKYPFLRDPDAFTVAELNLFLKTARGTGLRVIPLVQSLSHLEFALDHEELAHLRELPNIPTMLCPSKPEAVEFVKDLYREVLAFHREDEFFHLGGDETWFLGSCEPCRRVKAERGVIQMWAEHERKLIEFILAQGKRPIVWDDTFWKEPEALRACNLPKETVLHSWDYSTLSFNAPATGGNAEHGGGTLQRVEVYRSAGYETLAAPCLNYGQVFPRLTQSLQNTTAWARRVQASRMLGLINTSWACFHVPLQPQNLLVAATGALCRDPTADVGAAWQRAWLEHEFGAPADGVAEALDVLGQLWEIKVQGYGRPFTPLVYGYMNMVMHYRGGQDERRRRGGYPGDWNEVDFCDLYRKGVAAVKTTADLKAVYERLDSILAAYPGAVQALAKFAQKATRHKDEAEMFAGFAAFKHLSARVFSHLLRGDGNAQALRGEVLEAKQSLAAMLARAYEPGGQQRLLRAWWEPLERQLK